MNKITKTFVLGLAAILAPLAQTLEVGGPAPDLAISKIVKGDEVAPSLKDSGKITVVEFWATWCGPCRQSIPHLTELQKKYKDKNVRIIGISDETEDQVKPFVETQGASMEYTVALDQEKKTWAAFAEPFGLTGIPHAFVVDAAGTLVWHGHPMDGMDKVIDKLVEGKFNPQEAKVREELAELSMVWAQEYLILAKYGRDKEGADKVGRKLLDSGYDDAEFYGQVAWTLLTDDSLTYKNLPFALEVATFANTLAEGKSANVLDTLAFAQFKSGDIPKALETQKKAIEICDNEDLLTQLKQRLAEYEKI